MQTIKLHATIVTIRIHWGYSVRTFPASATQKSFTIPPPTTIVGALAQAYALVSGVNREYSNIEQPFTTYTAEFVEQFGIKHTAIHLPEAINEHNLQTIRYFTMPVQAPDSDVQRFSNTLRIAEMFGPVQIGYVACPQQALTLIILSRRPIPKAAAWSITRIGSRESFVYVQAVHQSEAHLMQAPEGEVIHFVNTSFYAELAQPQPPGNCLIERAPSPITKEEWLRWYSFKFHPPAIERNLVIPLPELFTAAKVKRPCLKTDVKVDGRNLTILTPLIEED
ncbi:MAG: type I-A CRISPR-associated protein Cas5a [Candidatus Bathyarchaeota archaeon]|nr:type I-A CRISPR-associated protein Cas5a [Candidatus Bathyarchaeota archaeon]